MMKTLFTVTLIFELLFGLGFLAAPGTLFGTFGVTPDAFGVSLANVLGSALLAFTTLLWYARSSANSELHKVTVRTMFVYWLISSIFMVMAQLSGIFNAMGWSVVILHVGFLIWYSVYAFRR
jgi:hypothetical protein